MPVATQHSVRDFVDLAARKLDMRFKWSGKGLDEKAVDHTGHARVAVDPRYFRPAEVQTLLGDPSKAKRKLGWSAKVSFEQLIEEMVSEDLKAAERDELVKRHGHRPYDFHE